MAESGPRLYVIVRASALTLTTQDEAERVFASSVSRHRRLRLPGRLGLALTAPLK